MTSFLAVPAKKERLEIRFALERDLANSGVGQLSWVREAYHLERR